MAAGDSAKADQIAFHIYTKLFHVLYAARASELGPVQAKTDKWFNLETAVAPPASTPTAELDAYRALSTTPPARALVIQVLLVVPPPGGGTALVHKPSGTRIEPEPRFVLLEEWVLAFTPSASSASSSVASSNTSRSSSTDDEDTEVLPATIYKNAIPLFRALFALLRILPAWRVVRKLTGRRPGTGGVQGVGAGAGKRGLKVVVRLRPEGEPSSMTGGSSGLRAMGGNGGNGNGETMLAFGQPPTLDAGAAPLPTSTHAFPGISHPAGTLTLSTTYLTTPTFSLESLEALLSSRFAVLDARPAPPRFTVPDAGSRRDSDDVGRGHRRERTDSNNSNIDFTLGPSGRSRREPLGEYGSLGRRESLAGYRRDEDDDDGEAFVPTLARRSITTSTTSTMSTGSPGRTHERAVASAHDQLVARAIHLCAAPPRRLPPRSERHARLPLAHARARASHDQRVTRIVVIGVPRPQLLAVLRLVVSDGCARRAGAPARLECRSGVRGALTSWTASCFRGSGPSSLTTTGIGAGAGMRGSPVTTSPLALRDAAGFGGEYTSGGYGRPLASEREREREREKGVPIGGASTPSSLPGGSSSSSGAGISGSRPGAAPLSINPFKSNTLSQSSLSGSLLRGVGGVTGSPGRGSGATSPIGVVFPGGQAPSPSPAPLATDSAGTSASGSAITGGGTGAAGSSVGSGGSGESGSVSGSVPRAPGSVPRERTASTGQGSRSGSFLKSPVDAQHDDISAFVKDIDAARPLLGRYRQQQQQDEPPDPDPAPGDVPDQDDGTSGSSSPGTSRGGTVRGAGSTLRAGTIGPGAAPPQAMLTSADEVDARLRRMNEEFMRSLVGLGGAGRASGMGRGSAISAGSGSGIGGGGSGSGSGSGGQGSEEVLGRLEFG
ncbi:Autophagy-related protein 13 [Mycena sanguinolenta]|uniref:Autophagy-related protein 13 n=1 Tax=Mycena sanguinolenta TaxID=230812 RepID=A0A8H6WXS6_9AGAR|nr:Autophagy-related protein 13 [Mycena sanguinolenta]